MNNEELARWFEQNKQVLETAYLAGTLPWQQSGFGLHTPRSEQDWEALRRPIAACIESAGTSAASAVCFPPVCWKCMGLGAAHDLRLCQYDTRLCPPRIARGIRQQAAATLSASGGASAGSRIPRQIGQSPPPGDSRGSVPGPTRL